MAILETVFTKVASSIVSDLIKKGFKKITKQNSSQFEKELYQVILETTLEFEKRFPITGTEKIPFYHSQTLLDCLLMFRFSRDFNKGLFRENLLNDNRIIPPTELELRRFFEIFEQKVKDSSKLKSLNIDDNYKEEIFNISEEIKALKDVVVSSIDSFKSEILNIVNNPEIVEEWSKQLDEIFENIKHFKPITALDRLNSLENRIFENGQGNNNKLLSKLYYLKATCLGQQERKKVYKEEAQLLIKAFKLQPSNVEYKALAAFSYYILGEKDKANQLAIELLEFDEFNLTGWVISCFLSNEKFGEQLSKVPNTVRESKIFKLNIGRWIKQSGYVEDERGIENIGLNFTIDESDIQKINYKNRYYMLLLSAYNINTFFDENSTFSVVLEYRLARSNSSFINANKILKEIIEAVKGTEIELDHKYYEFQLYCTNVILTGNKECVIEMERTFNELNEKPLDVIIRMSQAYNLLNEQKATEKATKIIENYIHKESDALSYLNAINYFFINNQERSEDLFIRYIDLQEKISRISVLNIISFIRHTRLNPSDKTRKHLKQLVDNGNFELPVYKSVLRMFLNIQFNLFEPSEEQFHKLITQAKEEVSPSDLDLGIHVAYALGMTGRLEEAKNYLKDKIDFNAPSEELILYCKILYNLTGNKPELILILKNWRKNFKPNYELLKTELYLSELQKDWLEVIEISKVGLIHFPQRVKFVHALFIAFSHTLNIEGIRENLHYVANARFDNENYGIDIAYVLLKAGLIEESINLIYSQASNKNNIRSRQAYVGLSINYPSDYFKTYDIVEVGSFVKYKVDNKITVIEITGQNISSFPHSIFIGKSVDESIMFQTPISDKLGTAIILRIFNKYGALLDEIYSDIEDPLSGLNIQLVKFKDSNAESISDALIQNFGVSGSLEKERMKNEYEKYYNGNISFSEIVNTVYRRNNIEAYFILTLDKGKCFKAISPSVSPNVSLTEQTKFVLDFTSICLFWNLTKECKIAFNHKFVISRLIEDELITEIEKIKASPKIELSLSITQEKVTPYFYPDDFMDRRLNTFQSIKEWVDENCIVESVPEQLNYTLGWEENHRNSTFLKLLIENRLLIDRGGYILLSNDIFYYRYLNGAVDTIVSPICFLDQYYSSVKVEYTGFMLKSNYIGINMTKEYMEEEFFKMLSGQENKFSICLENLKYNWNPNKSHIREAIRFIKSLFLIPFINSNTRHQTIIAVFSNLIIGMDLKLLKEFPTVIQEEFRLLGIQALEVLELLNQYFGINRNV